MFFGGMLDKPIAIVQVDAENCFGRLEWDSIRAEVAAEVPELGPVVAWKHTHDSYVEQPDAQPKLKIRGAEQGDTFGPAETGLTLARLSRDTRHEIHAKQMTGQLQWKSLPHSTTVADDAVTHFRSVEAKTQNWAALNPLDRSTVDPVRGRPNHPANEIQTNGGLVDVWLLDDATVMISPELMVPYLRAYDRGTAAQGGKRNVKNTIVTLYAEDTDVVAHADDWKVDEL